MADYRRVAPLAAARRRAPTIVPGAPGQRATVDVCAAEDAAILVPAGTLSQQVVEDEGGKGELGDGGFEGNKAANESIMAGAESRAEWVGA